MDPRTSFHRSKQSYEYRLRHSTNFFNSELLRGSFTSHYSPKRLRTSNFDPMMSQEQRFSSLHKKSMQSFSDQEPQNQSYAHLKDTLSQLQIKIKKAKQILAKSPKPQIQTNTLLDYEETISDIESNITKKNDYTYNQLTENSTKFLSFAKNQEIEIHKIRPSFLKNRNVYYISSIFNHQDDPRVQQHLAFSFRTLKSLSKFQAVPILEFQDKWNLPMAPHHKDKKTILLDIDQTILHSDQFPQQGHEYDLEVEVAISQTQTATAYISLRPYALTFLKNIAKNFQVIAFTASHESYAKVILDQLDPDRQIFTHRLYRNSCQQIGNNVYAKDIRIINRKPQNIVLIDNSPYSYIFQLQNGIPILPYKYGYDNQLPKLQKYLQILSKANDVRQINKKTFKFHRYGDFKQLKQLIQNLYVMQ